MKFLSLLLALFSITGIASAQEPNQKPNVLLISIDDLNDWIGVLGGHPQAKTPNIDRLAARGMVFENAHCQSPVCNPSRASMITSLYPSSTGIYFLTPDLKHSPVANKQLRLPDRFVKEGYYFTAGGKILHHLQNQAYLPNYAGAYGGMGPLPKKKIAPFVGHKLWDWGVYPEKDELMPDHKVANWAVQALKKDYDQPFFIASGFYRPHVPQFCPQKWFDLYPIDEVQLPKTIADDLKDISPYAVNLTRLEHVAPTHDWVVEADEWKALVQSYLACVSFVDHQVGKLIDALDSTDAKDNTYIVLYSDHGFHLGEKERWAKRSLWEDSTRVPLIIVGPGIKPNQRCTKPVELIDIYPTLLELTDAKADPAHEGQSLKPLLDNPKAEWPHIARTSFGPGNHAIRSERYRYIHYHDGSEEFYDHSDDPHEWHNLITNKDLAKEIAAHKAHLPQKEHEILGGGSTGHHSFNASDALLKSSTP